MRICFTPQRFWACLRGAEVMHGGHMQTVGYLPARLCEADSTCCSRKASKVRRNRLKCGLSVT